MNGNIANNFGSFDVVFSSGNGSTLKDVNGKEYIDFVSGIGVNCLGHNHPKLVKTLQEQVAKQIHISNYYNSDIGLEYSKKLLSVTKMDKIYFGNSGAEANEAAIKLARKYGFLNGGEKRKTIVALEKSFHGRTLATLCATGQDKFHPECFAPYPAGFKYIKANDYEAIKTAFDDTTCAFMLECVQGEGGVNLIDKEWAKTACDLARKAGAIVIADEVQTGIARTGKLLAVDHENVKPDVLVLGKALSGGMYPVSAVLANNEIMNVIKPGQHGSTFGGNPLAAAIASTALDVVLDENLAENAEKLGKLFRDKMNEYIQTSTICSLVRGKGLLNAIVINDSEESDTAWNICLKLRDNGLLAKPTHGNIIRFAPPLVINEEQLLDCVRIITETLKEFEQ